MEFEIKQLKELCCPKCGGDLTLDKNKAIAICEHCKSAFLLSDDEIEMVRKQDIEETALRNNYRGIVSEICGSYFKIWEITPWGLYMSGSMKKSFFQRRKMKKVKEQFDMPQEDDIFFSLDLLDYFAGLVLATSGMYYIEKYQDRKGKMTWQEFKNARIIGAGTAVLLINDLYFELLSDAKEIAQILKKIQQYI